MVNTQRLLTSVAKVHVLILDDWELMKLSAKNRRDLLEVLGDRHGRLATSPTTHQGMARRDR